MKLAKKIICIMLIFLLTFTGENIFFIGKALKINAHAEAFLETDLSYEGFYDTSGLQINGAGLIVDGAIQFERNGTGESIFTSEKIQLGTDYSFSTYFAFNNISPSELNPGTVGGFTFTLQPQNTLTSNDPYDNIFKENFSIGFISKYTDGPISAKSINNNILQVASINDLYISSIPNAQCEIYYSPHIEGVDNSLLFNNVTTPKALDYITTIWIGYDGTKKKLETLILDDLGKYNYIAVDKDLSYILKNEVYAGFMGSMGNAGNINEISEWYFRNDTSLIDDILIELDTLELESQMDMSEDPKEINYDLSLPTEGGYGSSISWESSDATVIAEDGTIASPSIDEEPKQVTLTATISRGKSQDIIKTFNYIVTASDQYIINADDSWLEYKELLNKNYEKDRIFSDLGLPRIGKYGSDINWISSSPSYLDAFGKVTRPGEAQGNQNVRLTATISKGGFSKVKEFDFTVIAELNDSDRVHADLAWLYEEILNGNSDLRNVITDLELPKDGINGSNIEWKTSAIEVIDTAGSINRPTYELGDREVTLTATINHGSETITTDFYVLVKAEDQSDEGKVQDDLVWLNEEKILNGNTDINSIVKNLNLPIIGGKGSSISWQSSDITVVDTIGTVNRPKFPEEDRQVTLTATVNSGSFSHTKTFNLLVIAMEATNDDRVENDATWLEEEILKDNSSLDNIMTDLYLPTIGKHGSNISWYSSDTRYIDNNGKVTRPDFKEDMPVTMTATIGYDSSIVFKNFKLIVKGIAQTDEGKVQDDFTWLNEKIVLDKNLDLNNITTKLYFPIEGPNGSTISWESSNPNFVSNEGIVVRPIFIQGDQTIKLTANLSLGEYKLMKTFTVIVKVGYLSAEMTVSSDLGLLDEQKIKNGNIDLSNVTSDLILPTRGDYGSYIRWESSDHIVIDEDGKVNRPKFTEEEKTIKLTAFVSFDTKEDYKEFTVMVKPLEGTDEEIIQADSLWIAENILKENSDFSNITTDLNLPTEGKYGSQIKWYSSFPEFIDIEGKVNRPSYSKGDTHFSLVATITKGDKITVKPFLVTVKKLTLTTSDGLKEDLEWLLLNKYSILNENISEFSVTSNLLFPNSPPKGSTITWASSNPEIISNTGEVKRPENGEKNKLVKITATLTLESETISQDFKYTVLEVPEGDPPKVISTTPENNSRNISWDTKEVVIEFDEDIIGADGFGIGKLNNQYVIADIYSNTMKFSVESFLNNGENIVSIPAGTVKDKYGNLNEGYEFSFTMDEKVKKTINIISSNPSNLYTYLPTSDGIISLKFDESNLVRGERFDSILFKSKNYTPHENGVAIEANLDKDSLNIKINETLNHGVVYELVIPQGVVGDKYKNTNKESILQFRTVGIGSPSTIKSIYPYNNQFDVSINQDIEIVFSTPEVLHSNLLILKDHTGKVYNNLKSKTPIPGDTTRHTISVALEPNKDYTLSGPYKLEGSSELSFELNFRTGNNTLPIAKTYPVVNERNCEINGDIIIEFDSVSPLSKASHYVNSTILGSNGEGVIFQEKVEGNRVILSPLNDLKPGIMYTLHIPAGEYKNIDNAVNDDYSFSFYTAKPIEVDSSAMNIPKMWFLDKDLEIDGSGLERHFSINRRSITSFQWDLGDGTVINTKKLTHKYYSEDYYKISLKIKDDKGFEYDMEDYINIEPISEVYMLVEETQKSYNTNDALVINYKIVLEQNGQLIHGETLRVDLYKDGGLQRSYDIVDKSNKANYNFTFVEEKGLYAGIYELIFTYDSHGKSTVVKEYINIPGEVKSYPFEFYIWDNTANQIFSDSYNLYVKLNGVRYKATRTDGDYTYYTVMDENNNVVMLQHGVRYYLEIEGWKVNTKYFSINNLYKLNFSGRSLVPMSKDKAEILDISIELPLDYPMNNIYIEGAKIDEASVSIQGVWNDLIPGYYEMKSENGDIFKTYKTDTFKINPSEVLKYGNDLMFRMVANNGIKSPWKYADILVAPQPTIKGKRLNVNVVNREYRLSYPTVFDGVVGGALDVLKDIPLMDGGNFGIGDGIPAFSGPIYLNSFNVLESSMDFEAGFKYDTNKKKTKDTKIDKVKKVTSVGYSFDFSIEGDLAINYYYGDDNWDLPYAYVLMSGNASRKQSSGYSLFGVIGIEAYYTMGVRARGALNMADNTSKSDLSGNITLTPIINGGASGNYGLGAIGGFIELSLPVTMFFPTNIIDVEANIEAKIENVFVGHKEVLLNKKYNAYKWSNRSRKFMRAFLEDEDTIYIESTLLPRDYIGRVSNWVANDNTDNVRMRRLYSSSESNLNRNTIMENIYPYTDIQLIENNNNKYLVWVDDNPNRDAINRTQLKFSLFDNGKWSEPQWIDDDGTADYTPTVTAMGDGVLMAWHNISKVLGDEGLEDTLYNSEIRVTEDIFSKDKSPTIITLTEDDKIDHSPKIASNNEMALLVWTKSEGLSFSLNRENKLLAPKNTDSLYFSQWTDGKWSEPKVIAEALPTVVDSNIYMNDGEGLLLYTLDMDNDFSTIEDREIFARIYKDSTWKDVMQITDNDLTDSNPQAVYLKDQWFITWIQDGNIKYMESLDGGEQESQFTKNIQNNYQLIQGKDLVALVYRTINEQGEQQIGASFYDIVNKTWGDQLILTESETYSRVFNPIFTEDGTITAAYVESKLIKEVVPYVIDGEEYLIEEINISDKVDLKILDYTPIHDLSISNRDIFLSSEIPIPGTVATVYVNVNNEGDFAEKALVELFDGDPEFGGTKIGETETIDYIPSRSSMEVSIDWPVDKKGESKYALYVVVSTLNPEYNPNNNKASIEIKNIDLAILNIQSKHIFEDHYAIEALIKNNGATKLDNIQLILEDEFGKIIETQNIESLDVLESQHIIFTISSEGLKKNQSGEINIYAEIISSSDEELILENNVFQFTILPKKLLVDNVNISQGQRGIDIEENISIGFNMDLDKGKVFDNITLVDDYLNKVSIEKDIDGSTLKVTPIDRLNYNTNYNLIVPNNALIDSFNDVINDEYSLSFTTMGTNPEIIFSYPGNNMEDVGINSSIVLRFNQNIKEGSSFSYIALYDNNSNKVLINKTLKDDTLTINAVGNLKENTTYTLEMPNRAIQNVNGEVLNDNYTLIFSTGLAEDKPQEPKEPDVPDYQGGNIVPDYQRHNEYSITTEINGIYKQITLNIIKKEAIINLEEHGSSIFTSGENIIMNLPTIPNIDSYRLQIPSNLLISEDNKSTLTLSTGIGSITITSGLLRGIVGANKGKAEIILAAGDKAKLTNENKLIVGNYPMISISILVNGQEVNHVNPNNPVKIFIPYKPVDEELENLESIIIREIGTSKTILPNGYYDGATGMVIFTTSKLSYYAVGYNSIKFKDVNTNNWYEKAVSFIAARNITTGTGNGNYSPNGKLTRGQFIVLLMKTYGFNPNENSTNNFADAGNSYYTGYLSKAKELGVSNGTGNNLFAPEKEINRQEMFTMLYRTLDIIGSNLDRDDDTDISDFLNSSEVASWAEEPMNILIRNKIINGSNGKLNPSNITTRAEIAQVLYNLLYNKNN